MPHMPYTFRARLFAALFALALSLFCLTPDRAVAVGEARAALPGPAFFETPVFFSMEGREQSALRSHDSDGSAMENAFGGSFLGALLFGYPYTGMGTVDVAALAILVFVAVRLAAARRRQPSDDRFDASKQEKTSTYRMEDFRPRRDARPPERPEPHPDGRRSGDDGTRDSADPYENAWSRKLGGPARPEDERADSPWARKNGQTRPTVTVQARAEAMWAHLSSKQTEAADQPEAAIAEGAHVPADFDVRDFLEGARALYVRLQEAWAGRRLHSLEPFLTPRMLETLRAQAEKNPEPVPVDIVLVNAVLDNVKESPEGQEAGVRFNVLMRTGNAAEAAEVDEVWRFVRGAVTDGMWRLSGIRAE